MNDDEAKIWAAQLDTGLPKLDLHGSLLNNVEEKMDLFLYQNFQANKYVMRVITGVGTGKMKATVRSFLLSHPLVDKIVDEEGAVVVILNE